MHLQGEWYRANLVVQQPLSGGTRPCSLLAWQCGGACACFRARGQGRQRQGCLQQQAHNEGLQATVPQAPLTSRLAECCDGAPFCSWCSVAQLEPTRRLDLILTVLRRRGNGLHGAGCGGRRHMRRKRVRLGILLCRVVAEGVQRRRSSSCVRRGWRSHAGAASSARQLPSRRRWLLAWRRQAAALT